MNKREALRLLIDNLSSRFDVLGYSLHEKTSSFIGNNGNNIQKSISFDLRKNSPDFFTIEIGMHIRLPEIEEAYIGYHPYITEVEKSNHNTLNINCFNLYSDDRLIHSFKIGNDTIRLITEVVWEVLNDDVFPIMDRYANRDNLVNNLSSDNHEDWVTSDRETRFNILISNCALNNQSEEFEKYAEEYIKYIERPSTQARLPMAKSITEGIRNKYFHGGRE